MAAQLFRASLRSVADPLRDHVCISCRARRIGAPSRLRQFHWTPAVRDEAPDGNAGGQMKDAPASLSEIPRGNEQSHKGHAAKTENEKNQGKKAAPASPNAKDSSSTKSGAPSRRSRGRRKPASKKESRKRVKAATPSKAPNPAETTAGGGEDIESNTNETSDNSNRPIIKVKKLLEENARRSKEAKKATAGKEGEKPKLSHVSGFINKKHTGTVDSADRKITPLDVPTAPVPPLSFGLDRVLFNPGVYQLRDPRSRVYNFDPYLGSIMPVTEFDFNALKDYITSSKDKTLRDIAAEANKKYVGSSSSMTSVLSHFHYLLSGWRGIDTRTLSQGFPDKLRTFTRLLRAPAAMFLHYQDGVYAIDADKEFDSANILMNLGKSMEKLLTLPKEDFERYRRSSENKISQEEEQAIPESYHYSTAGDFIMRSQLDAYDPRLPGTGMFDLKTRAVVSIRMDAKNFEHGLGYEIKSRFGTYESYEREYYDMIRAAFLKYSLQVRIGRMDGIFVAFHNVERIFGFQYISLPEMDQALHGTSDTALGDTEFQLSLGMWNEILNKATERFPKQSLRFHFETRDAVTPFMYIFAEPVTKEDIHAIQTKNAADIEAYQKRLLNLAPKDDDSDLEAAAGNTTQDDSLASSGSNDSLGSDTEQGSKEDYILAIALTVRNKVNGQYTDRPTKFTAADNWSIDYELNEMAPAQGRALYRMCQVRRQKGLEGRGEDELDVAANVYIRRLRELSKEGRVHRKRENELDEEQGIVVLSDAGK